MNWFFWLYEKDIGVFTCCFVFLQAKSAAGKKSIFAQKIAAKRAAEVAQISSLSLEETEQTNVGPAAPDAALPSEALETQFRRGEEGKC